MGGGWRQRRRVLVRQASGGSFSSRDRAATCNAVGGAGGCEWALERVQPGLLNTGQPWPPDSQTVGRTGHRAPPARPRRPSAQSLSLAQLDRCALAPSPAGSIKGRDVWCYSAPAGAAGALLCLAAGCPKREARRLGRSRIDGSKRVLHPIARSSQKAPHSGGTAAARHVAAHDAARLVIHPSVSTAWSDLSTLGQQHAGTLCHLALLHGRPTVPHCPMAPRLIHTRGRHSMVRRNAGAGLVAPQHSAAQ